MLRISGYTQGKINSDGSCTGIRQRLGERTYPKLVTFVTIIARLEQFSVKVVATISPTTKRPHHYFDINNTIQTQSEGNLTILPHDCEYEVGSCLNYNENTVYFWDPLL